MLADSPVVDYSFNDKKKKGEKTDYTNRNIAEKAAEALKNFEENQHSLDSLNINGVKMKL